MHRSNYSKVENGQREISLAAVGKSDRRISSFFGVAFALSGEFATA